ncbi:hypothetical protein COCC4DRAFT_195908 [Bipolaris maydis ATCC 48331]|uniref:Uncharacterized protein n=2 Tax=Cochliobolus heterostrophus TaxID=5016 RepID=M2UMZ2_COCH5|nr:uncharacterized protein COCC4DRAFT_195908 [Bipolaris maydis ATCC 48331]EMD89308.1 hypothetical protein COCHEDRAFT_1205456 [Bipolaris maydis C5]ENI04975.1 hypothetical protein COCC4DRAFT_195908 [Bipolaris maydis ATCC 48331]
MFRSKTCGNADGDLKISIVHTALSSEALFFHNEPELTTILVFHSDIARGGGGDSIHMRFAKSRAPVIFFDDDDDDDDDADDDDNDDDDAEVTVVAVAAYASASANLHQLT